VFHGKVYDYACSQHGTIAKELDEHISLRYKSYNKLTPGTEGISSDDWFGGQKVTDFMLAKYLLYVPPHEDRLK